MTVPPVAKRELTMQVNGIGHVHAPQSINAPHRTAAPTSAGNSYATGADQLDISHEADLASRVRDVPEIRADRVAALRTAIESGEYETDHKLNVALDRLLNEIA